MEKRATISGRERKLIVVIVILVVVNMTLLIYAFVQQGIARENAMMADRLEERLKQVQQVAQQREAMMADALAKSNERMQKATAESVKQ
ncbi:MAG: hypothetical protein JSS79_18715 [Bacteroidetes bacterium]|nr:hypothetical protein [Bacteroidota bacterium]